MKRLRLIFLFAVFFSTSLVFAQNTVISVEHRWPDSLKGQQHNVKCILVKNGVIFVGTDRKYLWLSSDTGKTWHQRDWRHGLNAPFGTIFDLKATPSGKILAGTHEKIYYSTNNGNSWQAIINYRTNPCFLVTSQGSILVGGEGIFRSTDDGISWAKIADTSIARGVWRMVQTQTPAGIILAGSFASFLEEARGIIRSTDNGQTWAFSNNGLIGWAKSIVDMAAWPDGNSEVLIATYLDGIYRSPDAGITWQKINEIKEPLGDAVGILPPLGVFAAGGGTVDGVWRNSFYQLKSDGTWERILPHIFQRFIVLSLAKFDNQRLLIGTNDGLLLMTFNTTSVEEPAAPISYKLNQNYPNPFNSSTTISFSIPTYEFVTLKVYDVLGREVATLVNENLSAGSYSYNFDASNLTSGVYLYKLQAGKHSETKKMMLMK